MDHATDITLESRVLTTACSLIFRGPPNWDKYRPLLSALADCLFPEVVPEPHVREGMAWFLRQKGSEHLQDEVRLYCAHRMGFERA
jgi:hypothetical protein